MRSFSFYLIVTTALAIQACAQSTAQTPAPSAPSAGAGSSAEVAPPPMKPVPKLSDAQMEVFLKTAPIVSKKVLTFGTTSSIKASLSDGKITHDVHIQCLDVYKPVWKGMEGTTEKNFRDSWKYNIAAYRLGRMLGINSIPMSVERNIDGKQCSVTWWVDNIWLVEVERRDKGIKPPATDDWVNQLNTIRVFDQLIANMDRNQGNLLITPEWKVWMIDHTRAFRTQKTLPRPETLKRIDAGLLQRLKALNAADLKRELGPWLRTEEIAGILGRRDAIVRFFENEVKTKGEDAVLTGLPRSTPHVTLP